MVQGCHIEDDAPPKITGCPTVNCLGCQNQTPHVHLLCAPAVLKRPQGGPEQQKKKVQFTHTIYIATPQKQQWPKKLQRPPSRPNNKKFPQKKTNSEGIRKNPTVLPPKKMVSGGQCSPHGKSKVKPVFKRPYNSLGFGGIGYPGTPYWEGYYF